MGDFRQQDYKFISALAAYRVGIAHGANQSKGNGLQKLVSNKMSQRIVDVFESI